MVNVIQNFVDLAGFLADATTSFPTSIILILFSVGLILFSTLFVGYLTAGAVVDFLTPESLGRPPQQRG